METGTSLSERKQLLKRLANRSAQIIKNHKIRLKSTKRMVVIRFNVGMIMSLVTRLETKLLVMKKEMFLMKTLRLLGGNVRLGILDELK